jgi:TRAP-type mannitol/chloroaromatic compound transport system substrate-binding protein
MLDEYTARNNAALQQLVNDHQVILKRLPDDVIARLKVISAEVMQDLVAEDPDAKEVYESYSRFAEGVKQYHRYSEKAYLNARDAN